MKNWNHPYCKSVIRSMTGDQVAEHFLADADLAAQVEMQDPFHSWAERPSYLREKTVHVALCDVAVAIRMERERAKARFDLMDSVYYSDRVRGLD